MLQDTSKIHHSYIVGPSGSGKSYIAAKEALTIRKAGWPIFVASAKAKRRTAAGKLHPEIAAWKHYKGQPFAAYVTADPMEIVRMWDANRLPPCAVIFDEGAVDLGQSPDPLIVDMVKLCRADSIKLILLSQNYKRIRKDLRDNCQELRLFNVSSDEVRSVASDYRYDAASEEKIKQCYDLRQYEHLYVNKALRVCQVIDKNGGAR